MNNRYEERLGTDKMLPLVFRMALPAVAAQFVNLLYNIVDRIYIGHIPGIGTGFRSGRPRESRTHIGKRFCDAYSFHYHHLADSIHLYGAYSSAHRSI